MQNYLIYHALTNVARTMKNPDALHSAVDYQTQMMDTLTKLAPSGSGFDRGTQFNVTRSGDTRLVFNTAFHHMNEHGYYDGWTEHEVIVTPVLSISGISVRVTGKDKNNIKEYIHDTFYNWLKSDCPDKP